MSGDARPDLSIIIVSWNTRELLDACLASLPDACAGLVHEAFVVDNASSDGSAAMVRDRHPDVGLIESSGNLGFTRGNNLAFPATSGDHVLLLNPDTVCPPGSLKALVDFARARPRLGACGPTLVDEGGAPTISWGNEPSPRYALYELLGHHARRWPPGLRTRTFVRIPDPADEPRQVDYVAGACLLMTHAALSLVGPLDQRFFMYFEETDWCRRARAAGFETWHAAGIEVVHLEGRAAAKASRFSLAQFQHSLRLYVRKHHGPGRVVAFRAALFVENVAKGTFRALLALVRDRERNLDLASNHWFIAGMQLRREIEPAPPS